MVDIAAAAVAQQPVENIFPPRISPRRRETLIQAIKTGLAVPVTQQPEVVRHKFHRPSEAEFRRYRELEKRRNFHAHQLGIDPTLIASRATLSDLSRDWEKGSSELMSWQRELLKV
jgi:hypothetical protein